MSDDPILTSLARLEAGQAKLEAGQAKLEAGQVKLEAGLVKLEAEQDRLRGQLNDKLDQILDGMKALREDSEATKGHVLYGLQENLTLSQRISKLEQEMRKR